MTNPMIFVNLPVKDLQRSKDFFSKLGYTFNEQFCDDSGACLVISKSIFAMLLTHEKFQSFMPKGNSLVDAKKGTEVLIALPCESREEVDAQVAKAVSAGGSTFNEPQEHGFMYGRSYQDLDGHVWEVFWMDPAFIKKEQE